MSKFTFHFIGFNFKIWIQISEGSHLKVERVFKLSYHSILGLLNWFEEDDLKPNSSTCRKEEKAYEGDLRPSNLKSLSQTLWNVKVVSFELKVPTYSLCRMPGFSALSWLVLVAVHLATSDTQTKLLTREFVCIITACIYYYIYYRYYGSADQT